MCVEGDLLPLPAGGALFDAPYRAPTLESLPRFAPVAVRKGQADGGPTVQVMYRSTQGEQVSLYIQSLSDRPASRFATMIHGGHRALSWIDGPLAYVVVARDVTEAELLEVARAVHASRAVLPVSPDSAAPPAQLPHQTAQ